MGTRANDTAALPKDVTAAADLHANDAGNSVETTNGLRASADTCATIGPDGLQTPAPSAADMTLAEAPDTDADITLDGSNPAAHASAVQQLAGERTLVHTPESASTPSDTIAFERQAPADPSHTIEHSAARSFDAAATTDGRTFDPQADAAAAREHLAASLPKVTGYEIMDELGRGGMGVVYQARQTKLNRMVAIKMVLAGAHAGKAQLARFFTEAEAVAQLQHPNIVQIYEVGEHDGLPFFTLEYVDGGSLQQRIAGKPQPVSEAAHLAELLALAMASAHQHNIIHRDLKPANVLLTPDGLPKITDFGLAKKLESDSSQTKSGTLMGTPSYMAPEQARGDTHEIGPLADVYALGVILYEMLTGRTPFVGTSIIDTLKQVQTLEPVPPCRLQPRVPRDLDTICLKCLQKEPHKRYPNMEALADDLHRFQAGEPIRARPVGRAERIWRWCKRNPRQAVLSGAIAALLIAVGISLSVMALRAAKDRETTLEARRLAEQRLEQAATSIRGGNQRQAADLLRWSDPLVETAPALADVRDQLHELRDQVALYTEFKELLDNARYYGLFGPKGTLAEARRQCARLIELYDDIDNKRGKARAGMPPLDPVRQQLLQEDYFEAFLVSAQVEWELVAGQTDAAARKRAAQQAVQWLDRAAKIYPSSWVLHQRRGAFHEKLGQLKEAKADMAQAAKIRPTAPLDRFWFGVAEHMQGDAVKDKDSVKAQEHYRRAIQEYASLLRLRPDHFWAYFDGAACHFQLGNLSDAAIGFTMCIQIRPEIAWPYYNRGTVLWQQKNYDAGVEDFGLALERNAKYADALCNRALCHIGLDKPELALADFERALAINPELTAVYTHRAETYRKLKRFPEAVTDFDVALKQDGKNPALYAARGASFLSMNDFARARADFDKSIELQPGQANHYRMHGVASLRLLDFEAAHRDWNELARLLPKSAEPFYNGAITYKAQRRVDDAYQAVAKALQLKPNDSNFYLFRTQLNHQQGKLTDAFADLTTVLSKLKVRKGEILNDYGDLLRTMRRWSDAIATYAQSEQLLAKQTDCYIGTALVHLLEGKPELAEPVLTRMLAANPDSARAYLRRAEFRRSQQQWEGALADCAAAAKLEPRSPLPALVRASIAAAQGDYRQSVKDADAVLQEKRPDGQAMAAAACVFSLAADAADKGGDPELGRALTERAAVLVFDTMEKGFLDLNYQVYNRFLVDPALARLRQHPGVVELFPVLKKSAGGS